MKRSIGDSTLDMSKKTETDKGAREAKTHKYAKIKQINIQAKVK